MAHSVQASMTARRNVFGLQYSARHHKPIQREIIAIPPGPPITRGTRITGPQVKSPPQPHKGGKALRARTYR
ncbi:hypothetical protein BGX38DRAFT_1204995 [Terfezia claveryi]|nr:hypothetical protein BGX38DRAFT_1204995 [Terfezia claveryi]